MNNRYFILSFHSGELTENIKIIKINLQAFTVRPLYCFYAVKYDPKSDTFIVTFISDFHLKSHFFTSFRDSLKIHKEDLA